MHIHPANDNEKIECDRQTYQAWGSPLTQTQFLEREHRMRSTTWVREGGVTWVAAEGRAVLSSCETLRMQSRLRGELGHTYGIASVFTHVRHRGLGHASKLLREAMARIEADDPKAQAFILYSEVGASLYERVGFEGRPITAWIVRTADAALSQDRAEPIEDFSNFLKTYHDVEDTYRVQPTHEQLEWFWTREAVYADLLGRPRPRFHALKTGRSFSVWMADYKHSLFRATIFHAQEPQAALAMLESAREEAAHLGLEAVKVWDTPSTALRQTPGIEKTNLADTLPMIRPADRCRENWQAALWREIPRAVWV